MYAENQANEEKACSLCTAYLTKQLLCTDLLYTKSYFLVFASLPRPLSAEYLKCSLNQYALYVCSITKTHSRLLYALHNVNQTYLNVHVVAYKSRAKFKVSIQV